MIKHTPGPFKVAHCDGNFEIRTMDDKCLADAWSYGINGNSQEMEANAKLFAAAPDLLEALELLLLTRTLERNLQGISRGESPLHDRCNDAIARAKGESS